MKKKPNMSVSQRITDLQSSGKKTKRVNFLHGMKEELKRVSWTTKAELRTLCKIVIGTIFALGLGIYLVDLIIRLAISGLGNIVRVIGG